MKCPVCGREYSFFRSGAYCSPECAEAAEKEIEQMLEDMMQEENEKDSAEPVTPPPAGEVT